MIDIKTATKGMTEGNCMKLLVQFFLPILAGNFFQQFYNFVDSVIVGKGIGDAALAAAGQSVGKIYLFFTIVEIFVVMWAIYLFSYIARFENTTKATMKNAFIITFANLPRTLLMLAVLLLGVFLVYLFTYSIVLVPGLCALLISYPMETIFRKYMSEEERAAEDERNGIYVSDQK